MRFKVLLGTLRPRILFFLLALQFISLQTSATTKGKRQEFLKKTVQVAQERIDAALKNAMILSPRLYGNFQKKYDFFELLRTAKKILLPSNLGSKIIFTEEHEAEPSDCVGGTVAYVKDLDLPIYICNALFNNDGDNYDQFNNTLFHEIFHAIAPTPAANDECYAESFANAVTFLGGGIVLNTSKYYRNGLCPGLKEWSRAFYQDIFQADYLDDLADQESVEISFSAKFLSDLQEGKVTLNNDKPTASLLDPHLNSEFISITFQQITNKSISPGERYGLVRNGSFYNYLVYDRDEVIVSFSITNFKTYTFTTLDDLSNISKGAFEIHKLVSKRSR